jgi:putative ABC transport system ATP-binding protein
VIPTAGLRASLRIRSLTKVLESGGQRFTVTLPELDLAPGATVALIGPSGCGKSTLLHMLALALRPTTVAAFALALPGRNVDLVELWRDGDLDGLARLRAAHWGYVLQTGGLLPFLTLRQNIALPQSLAGKVDRDWIATLTQRLDIEACLDRAPHMVSVGQRQRAAIARALSHRPAFVLADEPTASVHPEMADILLRLLLEQAAETGAAVVLATHEPDRALRFGFTPIPCMVEAGADGPHARFAALAQAA